MVININIIIITIIIIIIIIMFQTICSQNELMMQHYARPSIVT